MKARGFVAGASAAALTACTVGPDYQRPNTPLPASFAEPHSAQPVTSEQLAIWWQRFGDPELDKLVNRALKQNLDVEAAAARILEARARERAAGSVGSPEVDATGSVTRQRISEHAIPVPPGGGTGGGATGGFGLPGAVFTSWRVGIRCELGTRFVRPHQALSRGRERTHGCCYLGSTGPPG